MMVQVRGKGVVVTEALREYADKRLNKLEKHFQSLHSATVTETVQSTTASALTKALFACDSAGTGSGSTATGLTKFVTSVAVADDGKITVVANGGATGIKQLGTKNVLTLIPYKSDSAVLTTADVGVTIFKWVCGSVTGGTTIEQKYLPGSCRAA
ncbi:MAG: pilin [Comamonadaceae bacterium]|nr:MAG: pilin [Comamonadaceae bacterium]